MGSQVARRSTKNPRRLGWTGVPDNGSCVRGMLPLSGMSERNALRLGIFLGSLIFWFTDGWLFT